MNSRLTAFIPLFILAVAAVSACTPQGSGSVRPRTGDNDPMQTNGASKQHKVDTALVNYIATSAGVCRASVVRNYIAQGANPNAEDSDDGAPILFHAINAGATSCVLELLEQGAAVTSPGTDVQGIDALYLEADSTRCDPRVVHALVAHGANPNARPSALYITDLQAAVSRQNLQCAQALIESGANVNVTGKRHFPPLVVAQFPTSSDGRERVAMTGLLLEHGADPNARGLGGVTAMFAAVGSVRAPGTAGPCVECVRLLFAAGAKADIFNWVGETPLLYALRPNFQTSIEAIRALVGGGADVNLANLKTGETPLMAAAARGSMPIIEVLKQAGADLCAQDKRERDASDYASDNGHAMLAKDLRCHSEPRDTRGTTGSD